MKNKLSKITTTALIAVILLFCSSLESQAKFGKRFKNLLKPNASKIDQCTDIYKDCIEQYQYYSNADSLALDCLEDQCSESRVNIVLMTAANDGWGATVDPYYSYHGGSIASTVNDLNWPGYTIWNNNSAYGSYGNAWDGWW